MSASRHLSLLLVACAFAGLVPAAYAQSTRERLDTLETRLAQLEAVLQGAALVELSQGAAAQASELRTLRGELEVLEQSLATLRREHAAFAADVDRRLSALEARAAAAPIAASSVMADPPAAEGAAAAVTSGADSAPAEGAVATSAAAPVSAPVSATAASAPLSPATGSVEPGVLYGQGFDALKAGRYGEAIETLKDFRLRFPEHPLADNAAYWLGQSYYVSREYALAVEAFAAVGDRSADPGKAPDALLKKGLCEIELRRVEAARASFEAVIARYPDSDSARQARSQLDALR